jgi:hypothetical protein
MHTFFNLASFDNHHEVVYKMNFADMLAWDSYPRASKQCLKEHSRQCAFPDRGTSSKIGQYLAVISAR